MSELAWIDAALTSARPQALSALLRYFLRFRHGRGGVPERLPAGVEETGRKNGPPRDSGAPGWCWSAGNAGIDEKRKDRPADRTAAGGERSRTMATARAETLAQSPSMRQDYRDDVLRLPVSCAVHPDLQPTRQIGTGAEESFRGMSVPEADRTGPPS